MSFLRHGEIYRSDVSDPLHPRGGGAPPPDGRPPSRSRRTPPKERPPLIVRDEFPVGYSSAGCSPAEPASASPTGSSMHWGVPAGNGLSANGNLSLISVSQARGALQNSSQRYPAMSPDFFALVLRAARVSKRWCGCHGSLRCARKLASSWRDCGGGAGRLTGGPGRCRPMGGRTVRAWLRSRSRSGMRCR